MIDGRGRLLKGRGRQLSESGCLQPCGLRVEEEMEGVVSEQRQGAVLSLHLSAEGVVILQQVV